MAVSSPTGDPDETDLSTSVDTQVVIPLVTPLANTTTVTVAGLPTSTPTPTMPASTPTSPVAGTTVPGCISQRHFTVHLSRREGAGHGTRIITAILLNAKGHTLKTLKTTSTSVDVELRGLSGQKVTVRITTKPRSRQEDHDLHPELRDLLVDRAEGGPVVVGAGIELRGGPSHDPRHGRSGPVAGVGPVAELIAMSLELALLGWR